MPSWRNILGISAFYHDAAAALLHDGKILAAKFFRSRQEVVSAVLAGTQAGNPPESAHVHMDILQVDDLDLSFRQSHHQSTGLWPQTEICWNIFLTGRAEDDSPVLSSRFSGHYKRQIRHGLSN